MVSKTTIFIFLIFALLSCGPRTGIHEEKQVEETNENAIVEQLSPIEKSEENGRNIFLRNCAVCHSISTYKITGPGLEGVLERLPKPGEEYLIKYITNNDSLLKKDSYAKKLRAEYQETTSIHEFNHLKTSDKLDLIIYLKTWNRAIPQIQE